MSRCISIALTRDNLGLVRSLIKNLIEFDIYTPNPIASLLVPDAGVWVAVIDLEAPSIDLVHYMDFDRKYEGRYSSNGFMKVTKK